MKKLIVAAVLVALAGVSSIARAELTGQPPAVVAQAPAAARAQTTSLAPTADASDYAARETAAQPALGEFKGGDAVIYIGGGAVTVLVLVLVIVLLA